MRKLLFHFIELLIAFPSLRTISITVEPRNSESFRQQEKVTISRKVTISSYIYDIR